MEWEWLAQLERSGSIAPSQGWQPLHVALYRDRELRALAPLYLKSHSWGEFIFDFIWQEASAALQEDYFPKLIGMVPATPCSAYRFLIDRREDSALINHLLLQIIDNLAQEVGARSCAFNYVDHAWMKQIEGQNYLSWLHEGFRWQNEGYLTFEEYQTHFRKNQRRNVRRERNELQEQPLEVAILPAGEAPPSYSNRMYALYANTNKKFGPYGAHFLNQAFFQGLHSHLGHRVLFCCALPQGRKGEPLAMSLLVHKNNQLYGRYWGAESYLNALHFNLCYYEPLEWAIAHGYHFFDPGIGSPHKVKRGFQAVGTYSLHKFYSSRLQEIAAHHLRAINQQTQEYLNRLNEDLPFKEEPH